jgi:phage baseplate assembly protein W
LASIPHFAWPFQVVDGAVQTVEQDSAEEIAQCVEAVLNTPVGSRIDAPDYGVPDETFSQLSVDESAAVYLDAIDAAEPRARVLGEARVEEMAKRVAIRVEASR